MQAPWGFPILGGFNARTVVRDVIPQAAEILRSRWSGPTPPADPVEGQEWWDTIGKRCWDWNGDFWRLPGAAGATKGSLPTVNGDDPNNDTNISAGEHMADDGSTLIVLPAETKRLDAVYAPGSGQGFLESGAKANNAWYAARGIYNPTTRAGGYLATPAGASPTLPDGYTKKTVPLFWLRTDGSGNIIPYAAREMGGGPIRQQYLKPQVTTTPAADSTISTSGTDITIAAPPGTLAQVLSSFYNDTGPGTMYVSEKGQDNDTPVRLNGTMNMRTQNGADAVNAVVFDTREFLLDSSSMIRARDGSLAGALKGLFACNGFIVPRR